MPKQNEKEKYNKGWLPIPDTKYTVETIKNNEFVTLGIITVSGDLVSKEMDSHRSIKGYEPIDIARRLAEEKYGSDEVLILTEIDENV